MQTEGGKHDIEIARDLYLRAYSASGRNGYLLRATMLMPMIMQSQQDADANRAQFESQLDLFIEQQMRYVLSCHVSCNALCVRTILLSLSQTRQCDA